MCYFPQSMGAIYSVGVIRLLAIGFSSSMLSRPLCLQVNYEANGWVAHQVTDIWAKTSPDRGDPLWALWPMGGAWLCVHLWDHYTFSMDKVRHFL